MQAAMLQGIKYFLFNHSRVFFREGEGDLAANYNVLHCTVYSLLL